MKIYTCTSESVLAKHIPFSAAKLKFYEHRDLPYHLFEAVANELQMLKIKVSTKIFLSLSLCKHNMKFLVVMDLFHFLQNNCLKLKCVPLQKSINFIRLPISMSIL